MKNKEKKKWENERDLGKIERKGIYGENKEKERQEK